MKPNELAILLDNTEFPLCHEAATMLRKLDGQLAFRIDAVSKYQAKAEEQQAEIESLKANAKVLLNDVIQEYGVMSNMLNELSEAVTALKELLK